MLKKKIFIIFVVLAVLLISFSGSCFASSNVVPPPTDDTNKYYVVWQIDGTYYSVVTSNLATYHDYGGNENLWVENSPTKLFYEYDGSSWVETTVPNSNYGSNYIVFQYRQNYGVTFASTIYATNYDIVYTSNSSQIFFHKAPVGTLARQLEVVEMQEVQKEIILLLPLILVVVVSLVGLRKAWALLSQILHKA